MIEISQLFQAFRKNLFILINSNLLIAVFSFCSNRMGSFECNVITMTVAKAPTLPEKSRPLMTYYLNEPKCASSAPTPRPPLSSYNIIITQIYLEPTIPYPNTLPQSLPSNPLPPHHPFNDTTLGTTPNAHLKFSLSQPFRSKTLHGCTMNDSEQTSQRTMARRHYFMQLLLPLACV